MVKYITIIKGTVAWTVTILPVFSKMDFSQPLPFLFSFLLQAESYELDGIMNWNNGRTVRTILECIQDMIWHMLYYQWYTVVLIFECMTNPEGILDMRVVLWVEIIESNGDLPHCIKVQMLVCLDRPWRDYCSGVLYVCTFRPPPTLPRREHLKTG